MSETEVPLVKVASLTGPTVNKDEPMKSTVRLALTTEDGININFDLGVMATAMLGITLNPVITSLKSITDGVQQ